MKIGKQRTMARDWYRTLEFRTICRFEFMCEAWEPDTRDLSSAMLDAGFTGSGDLWKSRARDENR